MTQSTRSPRCRRHRPCGHPRTAHRDCPWCHGLYQAIWAGMRYWFHRLIEARSSTESHARVAGVSPATWRLGQRCAMRSWRRGVTTRLRAAGASNLAVRAAVHGRMMAQELVSSRLASQRQRDQWGGDAYHMGSPAWRRRTVTRYLTETAHGGREDVA